MCGSNQRQSAHAGLNPVQPMCAIDYLPPVRNSHIGQLCYPGRNLKPCIERGVTPTIFVSDGCYLCSAPLASAVTNSSGAWSVTVPLSQGIYNLYALATTNSNGYGASRIDSPPSNVITVTVGHA